MARLKTTPLLLALLLALGLPPGQAQEEPVPPGPLFQSVGDAMGLGAEQAGRVAFCELNGDGFPDLIVGLDRIYLNEGGRNFRPSPQGRILEPGRPIQRPSCIQFGDIDNDGFADLFLGRSLEGPIAGPESDRSRNEIWLGDGQGGFTRKKNSGVGHHTDSTISACFLDYDADGRLDLFVGNGYVAYGRSLEAFPDRLYQGQGDGSFVDVTESAGLAGRRSIGRPDSRRPTYGVTHTDWNNDGRQDLFVATYGRQWNRLWRNNGDGTFTDHAPETTFDGDSHRDGRYPPGIPRQAEAPFRANGNGFDPALADYDGDGDIDCFLAEIAHWWAGPSSDRSMLLVNGGPEDSFRFERRPEAIGRTHRTERWNEGDMHAGWIDIDNDGRLDLIVASSDYPDLQTLMLHHQEIDGTFTDWTDRLGFRWINATSISLADFDRDGATDIVIGTNRRRLTQEQRASHDLSIGLFRNMEPARQGNGFFNLRLEGPSIGARVTIWTGSHRQTREVRGGLGHSGHRDDTDCRFGIGKARSIDRVEVRWPDRAQTVQTFEGVLANRFYRLRQGNEIQPIDR